MALIQIDITESPEDLAQLLEQAHNAQHYQKLRMLYLLKTQKVKTLRHIAQIFGRHHKTLQLWVKHYRQGGLAKLLENHNDRFVDIPEWVIQRLVEHVKDAQFLPRIRDMQVWMQQELNVEITHDRLYSLITHKVLPLQQPRRALSDASLPKLVSEDLSWLEAQVSLHAQFTEWKAERGLLNHSQALSQLLGEFFGVRPVHAVNPFQQPGMTLIAALAQGSLTPKMPYQIPDLLTQQRLSERLGIDNSIPCRERWRRTFPGWTKQRDPDGVGWLWVPALRKYRPLLRQEEIQAVLLSPVRGKP